MPYNQVAGSYSAMSSLVMWMQQQAVVQLVQNNMEGSLSEFIKLCVSQSLKTSLIPSVLILNIIIKFRFQHDRKRKIAHTE